jgi:hypothetical protein
MTIGVWLTIPMHLGTTDMKTEHRFSSSYQIRRVHMIDVLFPKSAYELEYERKLKEFCKCSDIYSQALKGRFQTVEELQTAVQRRLKNGN